MLGIRPWKTLERRAGDARGSGSRDRAPPGEVVPDARVGFEGSADAAVSVPVLDGGTIAVGYNEVFRGASETVGGGSLMYGVALHSPVVVVATFKLGWEFFAPDPNISENADRTAEDNTEPDANCGYIC